MTEAGSRVLILIGSGNRDERRNAALHGLELLRVRAS
jgi:hypothetical protein